MKIAVSLFGTRVSPRFDCAPQVLLVDVEQGQPVRREEVDIADFSSEQRVARLGELGVDTLICGAIDRYTAQQLDEQGMTVFQWVSGEAEDALACLLRGELASDAMMGSGGRCCGRWRLRGGFESPAADGPGLGEQFACGGRRGRRGPGRGNGPGRGRGG